MIAFIADNHFGARPGYYLYRKLLSKGEIQFCEDDLSKLPILLSGSDCQLLVLNWISDTSGNPHPGPEVEEPLMDYLRSGRPVLLLHGASAAFHKWSWWRQLVGLRWVRANDPDGFAPSTHPVRPYAVKVTKGRHPLAAKLKPFSLSEDEIYIELEQTSPVSVLLETRTDEGTFPQAYISKSPWGGMVAGFIPGHASHAFDCPELVENVEAIIDYLL